MVEPTRNLFIFSSGHPQCVGGTGVGQGKQGRIFPMFVDIIYKWSLQRHKDALNEILDEKFYINVEEPPTFFILNNQLNNPVS